MSAVKNSSCVMPSCEGCRGAFGIWSLTASVSCSSLGCPMCSCAGILQQPPGLLLLFVAEGSGGGWEVPSRACREAKTEDPDLSPAFSAALGSLEYQFLFDLWMHLHAWLTPLSVVGLQDKAVHITQSCLKDQGLVGILCT